MIEKRNTGLYLNRELKIAITLVLIFALRTNFWISELLFNIGLPYLRFQKLWFLFLPGIYILIRQFRSSKIQINNLFITVLFLSVHYLMENYLYGIHYTPSDPIDLIHRWIYIYLIYFVLINLEAKYLLFIIKTSITLLIINLSIIYLDLFNFINVAQVNYGFDGFEGRLNSTQNLNIVSDMSVFAIILIFWLKYVKEPYKFFNLKYSHIYLFFFFLLIILFQASRGSLILLFSTTSIYLMHQWMKISIVNKITLLFILIAGFLIQDTILNYLIEGSFIFERLYATPMSIEDSEQGRIYQVMASWNNFLTSPVFGLGYNNAASDYFHHIYRSNFQYTQILASGGIILFVIYFYMVFKFFGKSFNLISSSLVVRIILVFVLILFIFRRPEFYFAIFAYLVYMRNLSLNEKYNNSR